MTKILIQIKNNHLFFSKKSRIRNLELKTLINTNVISQNELLFSDDYIESNLKLVHSFIKEISLNYNINTIIIKESEIVPLILKVISKIDNINSLYLLEETITNYKICNSIIKCGNIKYVNLYNIPTYLLELLDKEKIKTDSRNEILFSSNFIKNNNLDKFSSLYYKREIHIELPFSKEDEEDFISFININKYLKYIYINKVRKEDIETILEILYKKRLKNIKVYIQDNINDNNLIEYLKKLNKKNSKINGIQFKIDYSEEYLQNNIIGQIQLNTIKMCILIALSLVSSVVIYVFVTNYISMQKVDDIKKEINEIIAENKDEDNNNSNIIIEPNNNENTNNETPNNTEKNNDNNSINNQSIDTQKQETKSQTKQNTRTKNKDIQSLKQINEDTVGWLKVNNTNVDYPVVQAKDNEYYLNYNFKKQKDIGGWIFMDYRADAENLSTNTIIFGHNVYYSGVMFGTLYKVRNKSWYTKEENQIIEFNNIYNNMKWKIFSIYVVPTTNDYLIAEFNTKEKYQNFLNLITGRSIYAFNTPVSTDDKIITLSTCSNNGNSRLVVHAVLISD